MSKPNKLWAFGPPVSLALVIVALYVKRPDFRNFVDEKCPWVKENLGKYAPPFEERIEEIPTADPDATRPPRPSVAQAPGSQPPPSRPGAAELVKPAFDLQRVCADPSLWPKTVALKRNVYFPAVLNGKAIGTLRAPAGTEARLVTISHGKLGVEYRGGGAWLDPGSTDFEERVRRGYH